MNYKFVPMNQNCACEIISNWKYDGELAIYNYENEKDWILYEEAWGNGLFAVLNENYELIGELSVQFLNPSEVALESELGDDKVMWIGFGMRPDLTGKGNGPEFVAQCAQYAVSHFSYKNRYLGLGVYTFNLRAVKAYEKAGFQIYKVNNYIKDGKHIESYWMRKAVVDEYNG